MATGRPSHDVETPEPPAASSWFAAPRQLAREVLLRIRYRPVQNLAVIGLVTLSVIGLGIGLSTFSPRAEHVTNRVTEQPTGAMALAELDAGRGEQARQIAAGLRVRDDLPAEDAGLPPYVLGLVLRKTQPSSRPIASVGSCTCSRRATFRRPEPRAFLPGGKRMANGSWHGVCSRAADMRRVLPALHTALAACPEQATDIYRRLASAYLKVPQPEPEQALKFSQLYLQDGRLSPAERDAALLLQGRVWLERGEWAACREDLQRIAADSPSHAEAQLLLGRVLLVEGDQLAAASASGDERPKGDGREKYLAARDALQALLAQRSLGGELVRQAQYLLGLCHRRLADSAAALQYFARLGRTSFDTAEGLAAALEEAELHYASGETDKALEAYHRVLRQVHEPEVYSNPWVSLEELQRRLQAVYGRSMAAGQYDWAIEFVRAFSPVLTEERSVRWQAEAYEALAAKRAEQAVDQPRSQADSFQGQSRSAWREAGRLRTELARLRFSTREYPQELWASAEDFLRGQDYERAIRLLHKHRESEERQKLPRTLVALGTALLALDRPQEALLPLGECLEFHAQDPHCYRAAWSPRKPTRNLASPPRPKSCCCRIWSAKD